MNFSNHLPRCSFCSFISSFSMIYYCHSILDHFFTYFIQEVGAINSFSFVRLISFMSIASSRLSTIKYLSKKPSINRVSTLQHLLLLRSEENTSELQSLGHL